MTKKLATIRIVDSITPMEGYDHIWMAHVDGWQSIVRKDLVKSGDVVVFIEPGALCPDNDTFHFLEKTKFKVKTMRLRGNISQGLVLPVSILKGTGFTLPEDCLITSVLGQDVTTYLGLKDFTVIQDELTEFRQSEYRRYKNPVLRLLMRYSLTRWLGRLFLLKSPLLPFPTHLVSKTDEERIQNCPAQLGVSGKWVAHEKVDGMSGTWAVERKKNWLGITTYKYHCCSRNYELDISRDKTSSQYLLGKQFCIRELLTNYLKHNPAVNTVCLQGECVGPKIQSNLYHLKEYRLYLFNLVIDGVRLPSNHLQHLYSAGGDSFPQIPWAPLVFERNETTPFDSQDVITVLESSNGNSLINPDSIREGLVVRNYDAGISFKVVSPNYLIKKGE